VLAVLDAGRNLPQLAAQLFHFAERVLFARKLRRILVASRVREAAFQRGVAEHFDERRVQLVLTIGIGRRGFTSILARLIARFGRG
jgi:hypothetical protein